MGPRARRFAVWIRALNVRPDLRRKVLCHVAGCEVHSHGSQCEPWPELLPQPHRFEHLQRTRASTGPLLSPGVSFCFRGRPLCDGAVTSAIPAGFSFPARFTISAGSTGAAGSAVSPRFAVSAAPEGVTLPSLTNRPRHSGLPPEEGHALWCGRSFNTASVACFAEGKSVLREGVSGELEATEERSGHDKEKQKVECNVGHLSCEEEGDSLVAHASGHEVKNGRKKGRPNKKGVASSNIKAEPTEEVVSAAGGELPLVRSLEAAKGPEAREPAASSIGLLVSERDRCTDLAFSEAKLVPSEDDRAVIEALEQKMRSMGKKRRRKKKGLVALKKERAPCEEGSLEASQDADVEGVGSEELAPKVEEDVVLRNLVMLRSFGFTQAQLVKMANTSPIHLMRRTDHVAAVLKTLQSWDIGTPSVWLFHNFMASNIESTLRRKWEFLTSVFGKDEFKAMLRRHPSLFDNSLRRMRQSLAVLTKELGSKRSALEAARSNPGLFKTDDAQLTELFSLLRTVCGLTMVEIRKSMRKEVGRNFSPINISGSIEVLRARLGSSTLTSTARKSIDVLTVNPKQLKKRLDVLEEILGKEALPSALTRYPSILACGSCFLTRNVEFIMSMDHVLMRDVLLATVQRVPGLLLIDWQKKGLPLLEFFQNECGIQPADVPLTYSIFARSLEKVWKRRCLRLKEHGWRIVGKREASSRGGGLKNQRRNSVQVVSQGSKAGGGGGDVTGATTAEQTLSPSGPSISLPMLALMSDAKFEEKLRELCESETTQHSARGVERQRNK